MSEWQPIETAPSDRGVIVAWLNHADNYVVGEAYRDEGKWWWANTVEGDYDDPIVPDPTHWMPLPKPPK